MELAAGVLHTLFARAINSQLMQSSDRSFRGRFNLSMQGLSGHIQNRGNLLKLLGIMPGWKAARTLS